MEARRQAELEARRQREAEHQRMLEEQRRRAEEQREMARSGSIHYPGSPRPSVSTFFLKLNVFPCLGFRKQIASFILGAFCRLGGHFFDLYCKCFASLFTLTLLPFDIPLNVHHRYRQHVLLHPYILFQVLTLLSIFSDQFLEQISWP